MTQTAAERIRQTLYDLSRPLFIKQMGWALLFWAFLMINLVINIQFLRTNYPNPPQPPDLILDIIPETKAFIGLAEILASAETIVIVFILWQRRFKDAPKLVFLVGMMFWIRGYVILLTPLAQIQPPSLNYPESHFIAQTFYHGMFYSGHTASAFIQAFYMKGSRLRPVVFILATTQAFSLLASHSHYSIDVVGGLFVAYFITHFDFMRLVPKPLLGVKWMPWYSVENS